MIMDESDTYTGDMANGSSAAPPQSKISMPDLTLENSYKILKFYQDEPQWLANPRTMHAASADFAQASKIIGMNIQLERVGNSSLAAREEQAMVAKQVKDAAEIVRANPNATLADGRKVSSLWVKGQNGQSPIMDVSLLGEISELYGKHVKPKDEFGSTAGKELSDRMALEKQFGSDSPQLKKFDELTSKSSSLSNLGKLLQERASASPEDRAQYDRVIGHIGEKMGVSMQQDDQGRWIVNYGPQQGTVGTASVATQSQAQQKLLRYEAASELINYLQKNMEGGHIGVSGVLGEVVGDKLLPQLGVDTFRGKRADVRSTMIATREALMREISNDTRFSIPDRNEITKALPSSGILESLPDALQKLKTVRRILNERGRTYSEGIGLGRPEWTLTADEIKTLYDQNQATGGKEGMSFEKAKALLERFHHFQP